MSTGTQPEYRTQVDLDRGLHLDNIRLAMLFAVARRDFDAAESLRLARNEAMARRMQPPVGGQAT